jgi:hypothetical protein
MLAAGAGHEDDDGPAPSGPTTRTGGGGGTYLWGAWTTGIRGTKG